MVLAVTCRSCPRAPPLLLSRDSLEKTTALSKQQQSCSQPTPALLRDCMPVLLLLLHPTTAPESAQLC